MSRPLRIEFEDALYHVTSRGNRGEPIFDDDGDRRRLLAIIGQGMDAYDAVVFAYCLMGNHYHLVLRTHRANLSLLMRHINANYAQSHNRRHAKVGHLFQGRFKAILVQYDAYFLEVCRYVDLNPVRAGIVHRPQAWRWSSYRAHAGLAKAPRWLDSTTVYRSLNPVAGIDEGKERYARFVAEGNGLKLWQHALLGQIYLGEEQFVREAQTRTNQRDEIEVPRIQRRFPPCGLEGYLDGKNLERSIARAYLEGGYTQAAIAGATRRSASSVSRLIARYRARIKT